MDVLFRLSNKVEGYEDKETVKETFNRIKDSQDKSFNFKSPIKNLNKDDVMYFAVDSLLICKATYTGKYFEKEGEYPHYYEFKEWEVFDINKKIDLTIFQTKPNPNPIDNKEKEQEIERLLKLNIFNHPDEISDEDSTLTEGAKTTVTVNAFERNSKARELCIEKFGYKCSVCEFDFEKKYGDIGKGFIHVHHKTPLPKIDKEHEMNPIEDLIPVCPNCHAMLHKKKEPPYTPYTVKELKFRIANARD